MTNPTTNGDSPLLSVRDLRVEFAGEDGFLPVVDGVSFDVNPGEVVGLVGESGCGKSVTSLAVMGLIPQPPGRIPRGEILFEGDDLLRLPDRARRDIRGHRIAMVFQEPMTSLDPAFTVGEQIASAYRRHTGASKRAAHERAIEMLDLVGIPNARQRVRDYPHTFSGGMRQRVVIAIALSCEPSLLIADEPTTALDVTIQAQVLDLLRDLQDSMDLAVVFVTHDLGVVSELCDRVVVMYAGQVAETGPTRQLFAAPNHPYTHGLLECLPSEHVGEQLMPIPGTVPSAAEMPAGCRFHPRCRYAIEGRCDHDGVELRMITDGRHARCVRVDELDLEGVDA